MMAKSSITKAELFEGIEIYIKNKYGLIAIDTTIHISNGSITNASFKFEVKEVGK